jgi:hypothetical protein
VQALQCAAAAELALRGDIAEPLRWSSAGWAGQERIGSAAWPAIGSSAEAWTLRDPVTD